ncbi:RHS repeat-associated core domain-containing protein [Pseudomonas sp. SDO5532_S415]
MAVLPGITEFCRYQHDAMDRLAAIQSSGQTSVQRFYCNAHLITEIQDKESHRIFRHGAQLLAQQQNRNSGANTTLLATDKQNSVTNAFDATSRQTNAYTPYGHHLPEDGLTRLLGFNGEQADPVTRHYLLGNYRYFNPVLKRFNLPDRLSPFGAGGRNAYAYCNGDPVNRSDPTGHFAALAILQTVKIISAVVAPLAFTGAVLSRHFSDNDELTIALYAVAGIALVAGVGSKIGVSRMNRPQGGVTAMEMGFRSTVPRTEPPLSYNQAVSVQRRSSELPPPPNYETVLNHQRLSLPSGVGAQLSERSLNIRN